MNHCSFTSISRFYRSLLLIAAVSFAGLSANAQNITVSGGTSASGSYVSIDGLTLSDVNTTNPATMEFGIGLFKASASDGCNNNTIRNCIINMQRINNATATAPMLDGAVGIEMVNSTAIAAVTSLTPTN